MRLPNVLGFIWVVPLVAFSVASGSDLAKDRATLRGLAGVFVVVEELDSDIESLLPAEEVQGRAEQVIKNAGIPLIASKAEFLRNVDSGLLYISIIATTRDNSAYARLIDVSLKQRVALERAPDIKTLATTWSSDAIELDNRSEMAQSLTNALNAHLKRFVEAYHTANSK